MKSRTYDWPRWTFRRKSARAISHACNRARSKRTSQSFSASRRDGLSRRYGSSRVAISSSRRVMKLSNFRRARRDTEWWRSWKKTRGKRQKDRVYLARDLQLPPMIGSLFDFAIGRCVEPATIANTSAPARCLQLILVISQKGAPSVER